LLLAAGEKLFQIGRQTSRMSASVKSSVIEHAEDQKTTAAEL